MLKPDIAVLPLPQIISTYSAYTGPGQSATNFPATQSLAWTTRRIAYIPFILPVPTIAVKMFCINQAAVSGNLDIGIYNATSAYKPNSRLVNAGSQAQSGTTAMQVFDITDTTLNSDQLYFMAFGLDNATGTVRGTSYGLATYARAMGCWQETPGVWAGLPSTATPVAWSSSAMPLIGFSTVTAL